MEICNSLSLNTIINIFHFTQNDIIHSSNNIMLIYLTYIVKRKLIIKINLILVQYSNDIFNTIIVFQNVGAISFSMII